MLWYGRGTPICTTEVWPLALKPGRKNTFILAQTAKTNTIPYRLVYIVKSINRNTLLTPSVSVEENEPKTTIAGVCEQSTIAM